MGRRAEDFEVLIMIDKTQTRVDDLAEGVELDSHVARSKGMTMILGKDIREQYKHKNPLADCSYLQYYHGEEIFTTLYDDCHYVNVHIGKNSLDAKLFICDWNFIGPIIERDRPTITGYENAFNCATDAHDDSNGRTALEAIKRWIVKRAYGETVND